MESIIAAMAQWDNDVRAERTVAGMREAISRGRWVWVAPLGYVATRDRFNPACNRTRKCDNPDQGIRALRERRDPSEVLDSITAVGLKARNGKPLTPQSLHNLLKNPIYTGRIKATSLNLEQLGDFEPLVSEEVFRQVQHRLRAKGEPAEQRRRDHPQFPLRRFVRCGNCGTPLTGSPVAGPHRLHATITAVRAVRASRCAITSWRINFWICSGHSSLALNTSACFVRSFWIRGNQSGDAPQKPVRSLDQRLTDIRLRIKRSRRGVLVPEIHRQAN